MSWRCFLSWLRPRWRKRLASATISGTLPSPIALPLPSTFLAARRSAPLQYSSRSATAAPRSEETEQIQIGAVGYGDGTIWAGQTLTGSGPTEPLPVGAAVNVNVLESWTTSSHPTVTASGTLMTITLQATPGGLTSEIGEKLTLDPNLFDSTSLANGASYPALTFVTGQLTLVPEPSTGVMLLILGGVLFGWRCCRSRKSR